MTNQPKKPFLYKNREMIFPNKIETGAKIINQYGFVEEIYKVNKFKRITRFCSMEQIHDGVEIHRFYVIRDNNLNTLKKINQKAYDREFRIGLSDLT